MKNVGLRPYRFESNPDERRFAEAWENANEHGNMLAHLLDCRTEQGGHPPEPLDRDRVVAATVVQWLGSPVGRAFLRDCGWEKKR